MKTAVLISALFICPAAAYSDTIIVPDDYPDIQVAVSASLDGDTIIVKPGTYVETIDFLDKGIILKSQDGPEVTVIDGNQKGSVVVISGNKKHAVLEGFTITNGTGTKADPYYYYGGGIYCDSSFLRVENNIITANTADYGGGIAFDSDSNGEIVGNIIHGNTGDGISITSDSGPLIEGNQILANQKGNGIYIVYSLALNIIGNTIAYNEWAGIYGYINYGTHQLANNIITGNMGYSGRGGGIHFYDVDAFLTNNLIINNRAVHSGGGFFLRACDYCVATMVNTIVWGNSAPKGAQIALDAVKMGPTLYIGYSDVEGGISGVYKSPGSTLNWGAGMIDADPLFVNEPARDYHLTYDSPCREAGDPVYTGFPEWDFEGDPRKADSAVDIGQDEFYTHLYQTGQPSPGHAIDLKFVGVPGTAPVGLFFGSGVLDPPWPSSLGYWHLQFPVIGPVTLPPIPPPGVEILSGNLPHSPPGPYSIFMQAVIGDKLTNLCLVNVF